VSKRPGSPYRAGRSAHWLEIKNPATICAGQLGSNLETQHRTNRFEVITGGTA
jgi:ATP-dependent DNA ligase